MRYAMTLAVILGAVAGFALASDLPVTGEPKPTITEISDVPWTPQPFGVQPKVIYGEDDRIDVYEETDLLRQVWAASTCALIDMTRLTQHADGSYTISAPAAYRRFGLPPCDGEPFGNQPTAAYCSAFMVGPDLIATAGHCYSNTSLGNSRFVFGFHMLDATTPRLHFDEDEVYQGVEIVSFSGSGIFDHTVVRVDRPIRAPGARPFTLRRDGVVQPGEYVGIIGHPSGLPMKLAFGDTFVRRSSDEGYFVANLDAYGGNSGSPVINADTGILEGILVRGATDFVSQGTCFVSNVLANDGGRGEDSTKATVFAPAVPPIGGYSGDIMLDNAYYSCGDTVTITVVDLDLAGMGLIAVIVESSSGDVENVVLQEHPGQPAHFSGSIITRPDPPQPGSGILEAVHGEAIVAIYLDEADESGEPAQVEAGAYIDCYPPIIYDVVLLSLGTTQAQVQFKTDEPAQGLVRYGAACQNLAYLATGPTQTTHTLSLTGLTPGSQYYFAVEARDRAGNVGIEDQGGACYSFMTYSSQEHFTEYFDADNRVDIRNSQATFIPIHHPDRYVACFASVNELPTPPAGQILDLEDDAWYEYVLPPGEKLAFYGIEYDRFFVGSNGYVTFGIGDSSYQVSPSQHFLLPRISGLMCDLNPELGGNVFVARLSDRYVVTYEKVPLLYYVPGADNLENSHTFQIEIFLNGIIRITWLELAARQAVTGLSAGIGIPADFSSTKITHFDDCGSLGHEGTPHSADVNQNWHISLDELLRVIQLYNAKSYSCDPASPDGYQPGDGPRDCAPHDSDYAAQDWRISLSELLRLIQLYNASGYRSDPESEDGFQPIP